MTDPQGDEVTKLSWPVVFAWLKQWLGLWEQGEGFISIDVVVSTFDVGDKTGEAGLA